MFSMFKSKKEEKKSDFIIEDDDLNDESSWIDQLTINLSRLIIYAESADVSLQKEVAEKLANEAVKSQRQIQIVECGGLELLLPLTKSKDVEVQRLAAHALANLSVNSDNQILMAEKGAIEMLIYLLDINHELVQRQAAKALANISVNTENKKTVARKGALPKLIKLCNSTNISVRIEVIAAIANLAVDNENEKAFGNQGTLPLILDSLSYVCEEVRRRDINTQTEELAAQCCRAIRNLSVHPQNKQEILTYNGLEYLHLLKTYPNSRISQQSNKALANLEQQSRK